MALHISELESVTACLEAPYFRDEGVAVHLGDCLDGLARLPDECVSLTVTSPPYNIGKEYEHPLPLDQYLDWCTRWMAAVHRVTRPSGAFWLNVGYVEMPRKAKALPLAYLLWDRSPFYLIQEVVWNYGAGVAARKSLSPRNEKLLWFVKNPDHFTFHLDAIRDPDVKYPHQKKNGKLRCNTIGKNPSDVWQIAKVTSGTDRSSPERTPHPAQFPLDLINRIILGFSSPGELVLDPFMGSGTVALSCLAHGRACLGFEIDRAYCGIAAARIAAYLSDRRSCLFA